MRIYNSRLRVPEQLKMMRDITAVVATVNYIDLRGDLLVHLGFMYPDSGVISIIRPKGPGPGL